MSKDNVDNQEIEKLLSLLNGFKNLEKEEITSLSSLFEKTTYKMGEPVLVNTELPKTISFLINGEIRVFKPDNGKSGFKSLSIVEGQYIIGWSSILFNEVIEYISAASEIKLLTIKTQDFLNLLEKNKTLKHYFYSYYSLSDIWYLLSSHNWNSINDLSLKESKQLATEIYKKASSSVLFSENINRLTLDFDKYKNFISNQNKTLTNTSLLDKDSVNAFSLNEKDCLRIISIPRLEIKTLKSSQLNEIKKPKEIKENLVSKNNQVKANTYSKENQLQESENNSFEDSSDYESKKYKFFSSGKGPAEEILACMRTVAHFLNLPIKVDVLSRLLKNQFETSNENISLPVCAQIAETLGLQTQLLLLPTNLLPRLDTPSLVHLGNTELSVLLASSRNTLKISRPLIGIDDYSLEDIAKFANPEGKIAVLVLRATERTPRRKFGLAWFLPAIKKNRRALIEVFIASFFVQLFQLMNPLVVQQIIDKVIGKGGFSTLPVLAVLLFAFSIFENVLTAVRTNLFIDTSNRIDISLGEQVIDHLFRLPLSYFDRRPVGELSSRLSEMENIRSFLTGTALTVVLDSIFAVIYIVVMIAYSWVLTIVALLVAPLLALITFSFSPIIKSQIRTKAQLNAKTQNHLIEVLTGIQTVKAQNFELNARWRWKDKYSEYISQSFKNAVTTSATNGFTKFLNQISSLSVLCVGAYLVLKGNLTLGQLIAFRIISGYVTQPLLRLSNVYQSFQQTAVSLERLADIVDTPRESTESDSTNISLPPIEGDIKIEDLSFRFKSEGALNLSQVNLHIEKGNFVAIVGQSGSGKSTLTKLITRLYEPLSGKIKIDNYDISKVELYSLRNQIGIVPQDSLLFDGSVKDNISLSNPDTKEEDIIKAAKIASSHEFIMSLPMGYSTSVGERGSALSGGQRQRIAIARTIIRKPELLIMDEATSALDYQTERQVSLSIMDYFKGKTVLFITHRLHSIVNADKIIVMHDGLVAEEGTHEELLEMRGRYFALYNQQGSNLDVS